MAESRVPKHVGIILDGNRRFAKRLMMKPWMGHEWGAGKVRKLLDWGYELGVEELTLYSFSVQNFDRPKEEFDFLIGVFRKEFDSLMEEENQKKLRDRGLQINFIGRLWMFPQDVHERMQKLMELTKDHKNHVVNFAMAYGGREEVVDAVKKISADVAVGKVSIAAINEEVFSQYLYRNSNPDMIIRTGGEKRTSNFLIWQSPYAEWFFLEKTWPEFEKEDFVQCLQEFGQRERRFGK